MKISTPRWWYRRSGGGVAARLLQPLAAVFAGQTARRIQTTTSFDPGVPVISIGNLTVGGSGKTPVVRETLRMLARNGVDAHAVSRGYGGSLVGPVEVDPDHHTAAEVGDEPLMIAQEHPVWIARDRAEGARAAVAAGAKLLVLDDAHQNPSVLKTRSIIVVDGETRNGEWPFGDGSVVPAGPMREPFLVGLARADGVVVMLPSDMDAPDPALLTLFGDLPVTVGRLKPTRSPSPGPKLGFAGIAKPWRVERSLRAAGVELKGFRSFPDHGVYSPAVLAGLAREADRLGAGLITTEKDWVRLPPDWRSRVEAWPVRVRFDEEDTILDLLPQDLDG